jgi:hypothetical protein
MHYRLARWVLAVMISTSLFAYRQAGHLANSEASSYLLRVQRTTRGESSICVLLRHDGQFHVETIHDDRIQVMEGGLPEPDLIKVQQMLDNDGLRPLSSGNVASPSTPPAFEIVQISIFRTDHWQNLIFSADKDVQTAARQSLNPLLKWVEALPRHAQRVLTEDESNNCQSPKKIELKTRP